MKAPLYAALAGLLLAGCAGYSGSDLIAGKSTAAEVVKSMGEPSAKSASADGSVWLYPRGPEGRQTYAVTLGKDGVLRSIEQRLTRANVYKLIAGTTTSAQVRELLGPPGSISSNSRLAREVWEYKMLEEPNLMILWVQFSTDGIVREVMYTHDPEMDKNSGASLP